MCVFVCFPTVLTVNLVIKIDNSTFFYEVSFPDHFCKDFLSHLLKTVVDYKNLILMTVSH